MEIGTFDAMAADDAAALVRPCADVGWWVDAVVAGRPYGGVDALVDAADDLAERWSGDDVEGALADHPRIGEKPAGEGASAGMSRGEQAGVDTTGGVAQRLVDGNALYEKTFDRIFLVRAAGRSAEEILEQLELRLQNDPDTELAVTAGQLREIAALRLKGLFS